jgi:putative transposase
MKADPKTMIEALRRVLKRLHYPLEVMLVCVRWYVAYPLSLRHLEEMMAERGVVVDHSTIHRWAIKILPILTAVCRRLKLPVAKSRRVDETYVKVGGQWKGSVALISKRRVCTDGHATALMQDALVLPVRKTG